MDTTHDAAMKKIVFYVFIVSFVVILLLTTAMVFFNVGGLSIPEREKLFNGFILEVAAVVVAVAYSLFGLRRSAPIVNDCNACIAKITNRVEILSHDIEFACKILNVQRYGGLKFQKGDFRKLWKHFAYLPESEFFAFSYIPLKEWSDEYAERILIPTQSRIETDNIRALRIFAVDNDEELEKLKRIIELHKKRGIPVAYVHLAKLVEKGICKKPLDHSFFLIDNSTLVLFHLEHRELMSFEIITEFREVQSYMAKFQQIRAVSTTG